MRYFTVVLETGSISRASELLGISQPAISKAMKLLESELGMQLFVANGRGITPTDQARQIALKMRGILSEVDSLVKQERREETNRLSIGSFEVFTTHLIGPLLENYFPEFEVDLLELTPGRLEEKIAQGSVDYGITYLPIPHGELDIHEITQAKMIVAGSLKKFASKSFDELPFVIPVIPVEGSPTKVKGLDGWPDDRIPRNVKYRVTMMESALELCRRGMAVAYLPEFVVRFHNQTVKPSHALGEISVPHKGLSRKQPVYLIKRKSDVEDARYKRLAKGLRQLV